MAMEVGDTVAALVTEVEGMEASAMGMEDMVATVMGMADMVAMPTVMADMDMLGSVWAMEGMALATMDMEDIPSDTRPFIPATTVADTFRHVGSSGHEFIVPPTVAAGDVVCRNGFFGGQFSIVK